MIDQDRLVDVATSPPPDRSVMRSKAQWLVIAGWLAVITVASATQVSWPLRRAALFLHLGSLIAGFGAVLVADIHGVLWLIGRRRLRDVLQVTAALHPVIWGGLVGLVVSGIFLHPNLLLPRTQIKLVLVLVATLNGMWAHRLSTQLKAHDPEATARRVDQRLLLKTMVAGAISQASWWGATLIGFLATTSR